MQYLPPRGAAFVTTSGTGGSAGEYTRLPRPAVMVAALAEARRLHPRGFGRRLRRRYQAAAALLAACAATPITGRAVRPAENALEEDREQVANDLRAKATATTC